MVQQVGLRVSVSSPNGASRVPIKEAVILPFWAYRGLQ